MLSLKNWLSMCHVTTSLFISTYTRYDTSRAIFVCVHNMFIYKIYCFCQFPLVISYKLFEYSIFYMRHILSVYYPKFHTHLTTESHEREKRAMLPFAPSNRLWDNLWPVLFSVIFIPDLDNVAAGGADGARIFDIITGPCDHPSIFVRMIPMPIRPLRLDHLFGLCSRHH